MRRKEEAGERAFPKETGLVQEASKPEMTTLTLNATPPLAPRCLCP